MLDEACRRDPEAGSDRVQDVWGFQQGMGVGGRQEGVPSPSPGESQGLPPGLMDWPCFLSHPFSVTLPTWHEHVCSVQH